MSGSELRVVDFHGDSLVTFQHQGKPVAALRPMAEHLGLDWSAQRQRVERDPVLATCVVVTTTQMPGDTQARAVSALPIEMVPLFLAKVSVSRVRPEMREKLVRYQRECGKVLYDYWTSGVAVRGDLDGIVTGIDPSVMKAFGGLVKGILHKQLSEIIPMMVEAEVTKGQFGTTRDALTAGQVCDLAKVEKKGRRGLVYKVSNALRRYCARVDVAPREGCLGASRAYVFPVHVARQWLDDEGREMIQRYLTERSGQMKLKLVG